MTGLMRANAARQAMRNFGFDDWVINETINELLELYGGGVDAWGFIEEAGYNVLINRCLDNQEEQERQVAQEQHELVLQEQEENVEEVMDTSAIDLLADYEHNPVEGGEWVRDDDDDNDDDEEMIELTPEPLCEELEELLREIQEQNRKSD